jgi:hypothetical protein
MVHLKVNIETVEADRLALLEGARLHESIFHADRLALLDYMNLFSMLIDWRY